MKPNRSRADVKPLRRWPWRLIFAAVAALAGEGQYSAHSLGETLQHTQVDLGSKLADANYRINAEITFSNGILGTVHVMAEHCK